MKGILLPITVFFFRLRMMNSKLYRKSAISMSATAPSGGLTCRRASRAVQSRHPSLLEAPDRYLRSVVPVRGEHAFSGSQSLITFPASYDL